MSDDKPTNVARLPRQTMPAKVEIDFPSMIMMCIEKGLDPQVIVTMFQGEKERQHREALDLVKAEIYGDLLPVLKDGHNKHLGNKYATIPAMMMELQPLLKHHGVFVGFECGALAHEPPVMENSIRVRIVLSYGGYSDRSSYLDEPISRGGVRGGVTQMTEQQAITSATTYAARTLLKLKFNIMTVDDDDDAESGDRTVNTKTDTKTSNVKADTSIDHEQFKAAFRRRLHLAKDEAEITELLAHPEIAAWLANAPGPVKVDTDVMLAAKRKILAEAKPKQEEAKQEQEVGSNTQAPSELLTRVLARIASCETTTALDSCAIAPEFTTDLAKLNLLEGEVADEAIKARHRALGGKTA